MASRNVTRGRAARTFVRSGRSFVWVPFAPAVGTLTFQTQGILVADLLTNYFTDTGREIPVGTTVTRIRGTVSYQQVTAALQAIQVSVGIYVAEESSDMTEGIQAELTDPLWRDDWVGSLRTLETSAGGFSQETVTREIDSKAKRKLKNAERLQLIGRTNLSSASADLNVHAVGSILLMMP